MVFFIHWHFAPENLGSVAAAMRGLFVTTRKVGKWFLLKVPNDYNCLLLGRICYKMIQDAIESNVLRSVFDIDIYFPLGGKVPICLGILIWWLRSNWGQPQASYELGISSAVDADVP